MKKIFTLALFTGIVFNSFLFANSANTLNNEEKLLNPQVVSKALGHTLARNLMDTPGFHFDIPCVVIGMQEALAGKPSPLSDSEYEQAFDMIQQKYLDEISKANLDQASTFLDNNAKETNVVEIIPGKLQMSVLEEGEGSNIVHESDSPVLLYKGKYLDETNVIGTENGAETIPLNQAIPGLKHGLVGAKKGEKRRLYIHPEFCHSPAEQSYFPDPLMILDVTVLETNTSSTDDNSNQ